MKKQNLPIIKKSYLVAFIGALLSNLFFVSQTSALSCVCPDGISSPDIDNATACCTMCESSTVTFDGRSQSCGGGGRTATEVANEILSVCGDVSPEFGSRAVQTCTTALQAAQQTLRDGTPGSIAAAESALVTAKAALAEQQQASESYVQWTSPIGAVSPTQLIGKAIKTVLGILGAVALLIFVYGGFVWMTSGGSPEKIKTARMTLVWAVLGMAVIFLSYAAVDFVLKAFGV